MTFLIIPNLFCMPEKMIALRNNLVKYDIKQHACMYVHSVMKAKSYSEISIFLARKCGVCEWIADYYIFIQRRICCRDVIRYIFLYCIFKTQEL